MDDKIEKITAGQLFHSNIARIAKVILHSVCKTNQSLMIEGPFQKVLRWVGEEFAFNLKIIGTEERLLTQQEISMKIGKLGN